MKIILFGSNGMLGKSFKKNLLNKNIEFDIFNNKIHTIQDILSININHYDLIINCIGCIPQKQNKENSVLINTILPHMLTRYKGHVIHFSTDCIFSGKNNKNYYEKDSTDFASDWYGQTKRYGELKNYKNAITIRTSIIGTGTGYGLIDWFLSMAKQKLTIYGYSNCFWNGFTSDYLSYLILNDLDFFMSYSGLLQCGTEKVSKYDILLEIKKIMNIDCDIQKQDTPQSNKCLKNYLDIPIDSIFTQLSNLKKSS